MDITLPQALLLLTLNDETGKTADGYYQPALTGAALVSLFLAGTIELQSDPEAVIPLRHTRDLGAFLTMCDQEIGAAPKPRPLAHWVSALAGQKDFIATLADELCHLGALSREKTRLFGLFTRTVWPEASPALETALKAEMAAAMFSKDGQLSDKIALTIAFADAVDLLRLNFDPDALKTHAARIAAIRAGDGLTARDALAVLNAVELVIEDAATAPDSVTARIIQ